MLDLITTKLIGQSEIKEYREKYGIGIYNKTSTMKNPEPYRYYFSLTNGCCACGFYQSDPGNGHKLFELLYECVNLGQLILFFYWDDGDYKFIENNVHCYINKTKQVRISIDEFLYDFLSKHFEGDGIVFFIHKLHK